MHGSSHVTLLMSTPHTRSCNSVRVSTADTCVAGRSLLSTNMLDVLDASGDSSLEVQLSATVPGPTSSNSLSQRETSSQGRATPPRSQFGKSTREEALVVSAAAQNSPDLATLTAHRPAHREDRPRYSSCNESTEFRVSEHAAAEESPQCLRLSVFPLSATSAAVSCTARDRYANATTDSSAFSPHSVSSATRSSQTSAVHMTSMSEDGAAVAYLFRLPVDDATEDEVPVFLYDSHSPRKRVRRDGECLSEERCESPSSRYGTVMSSQMSGGDMGASPVPESSGRVTVTEQSLPVGAPHTNVSTGSLSRPMASPCVNVSSDTSLRLLPTRRHRTLPVAARAPPAGSEFASCRQPSKDATDASASLTAAPAAASSVSASTADGLAGPVCADSTHFCNAIPTLTTSIPRPTSHLHHSSSPRVERSLDTNLVDLTRVPIPGDVRINILGRGAADIDDDDSDVEESTRERMLEHQVQRMYGRIVKAHKTAARAGEAADNGTKKPPRALCARHLSTSQIQEVVAQSPLMPHNTSTSPRTVRFHVPDDSTASQDSSAPPAFTVTAPAPAILKRHVGFQLTTPQASPVSRPPLSPSRDSCADGSGTVAGRLKHARPHTPLPAQPLTAASTSSSSISSPSSITQEERSGEARTKKQPSEHSSAAASPHEAAQLAIGAAVDTSASSTEVVETASKDARMLEAPRPSSSSSGALRVQAINSEEHCPVREPNPPTSSTGSPPTHSPLTGPRSRHRGSNLPRITTSHAHHRVAVGDRRVSRKNKAVSVLPSLHGDSRVEKSSVNK